MRIEELRVGNRISYKNRVVSVHGINAVDSVVLVELKNGFRWVDFELLKPTKLTYRIFLDNDFDNDGEYFWNGDFYFQLIKIGLAYLGEREFNYVHEVQNLLFDFKYDLQQGTQSD